MQSVKSIETEAKQFMIAIVAPDKNTTAWVKAINDIAPEISVSVWPEVDPSATLLLCWNPPEDTFVRLPNVKAIYVMGAGTDVVEAHPDLPDDIPIERLTTHQLASDMFDYVFHCLETWRLQMHEYGQSTDWTPLPYRQRNDLHVTVMGLGHIGAYVAKQLFDSGYQAKGWSRSLKSLENIQTFAGPEQLIDAVSHSDALICLLSLNNDTRDILDHALLSSLNPRSCLINVARGEHLVEQDLLQALSGPLEHAFLDVFRTEPLPAEHPFWHNQSISITPHIASLTDPSSAAADVVNYYRSLKNDV
jgi:glyoxylate/hydroxypyruvate reductase A